MIPEFLFETECVFENSHSIVFIPHVKIGLGFYYFIVFAIVQRVEMTRVRAPKLWLLLRL